MVSVLPGNDLTTITLSDLTAYVHIGVDAHEVGRRQLVVIEVEVDFDARAVIADDDLGKTINYASLAQEIIQCAEGRRFNLLETLVADIVQVCSGYSQVVRARVGVSKSNVGLGGAKVSVRQYYVRAG